MDIKIYGNKKNLYQWDLNQKLILNDIPQNLCNVHLCHKNDLKALVCDYHEDENGQIVVNIPNILLQTPGIIEVYIYINENDDNMRTSIYCRNFGVTSRPKPESYVYEETEILNYETLNESIRLLFNNKVDKTDGKELSSNDFDDEYKNEIDKIKSISLYTIEFNAENEYQNLLPNKEGIYTCVFDKDTAGLKGIIYKNSIGSDYYGYVSNSSIIIATYVYTLKYIIINGEGIFIFNGNSPEKISRTSKELTNAVNSIIDNSSTIKKIDNKCNDVKTISDEALIIAKGKNRSLTFTTKQELDDWLSGSFVRSDGKTKDDLQNGDNLYIVEVGVPDYWWDSDNERVQVLETQKVDLSEYALKNNTLETKELTFIRGIKTYLQDIENGVLKTTNNGQIYDKDNPSNYLSITSGSLIFNIGNGSSALIINASDGSISNIWCGNNYNWDDSIIATWDDVNYFLEEFKKETINDNIISNETVWSSQKVANMIEEKFTSIVDGNEVTY